MIVRDAPPGAPAPPPVDGLVAFDKAAIPLHLVAATDLTTWCASQPAAVRDWVAASGFQAARDAVTRLPTPGAPVLLGLGNGGVRGGLRHAAATLPAGDYRLAADLDPEQATAAATEWALASRHLGDAPSATRLCWPAGADKARAAREVAATILIRDLVNLPANRLGPAELADIAIGVADAYEADVQVIAGDDLLAANYPAVHAVGRASARPPCLVDIRFGDPRAPKVTLVGKGVCFDSGGLTLKTNAGMLLMKKDMAGAAHALALGQMVMDARLPVRLRILLPLVENMVGGDAMRPSDILDTRAGLTVEIGSTDAEGRLILADALSEASREAPDLILDFATLTSAARIALGPAIGAVFTDDEALAGDLQAAARETDDPLWRLPMWPGYEPDLKGDFADLTNYVRNDFAGAIYAALFLKRFVDPGVAWAHLDIYAWNLKASPGRPIGGDAQGLRAAFRLLEQRYPAP